MYKGNRKVVVLVNDEIVGYVVINLWHDAFDWDRAKQINAKVLVTECI